jgi:DNA-directed RNA polymerase subunit beta'
MTQLTMRAFALSVPAQSRDKDARTIVATLPRLDELFEAGKCPGQKVSAERENLAEMLRRDGVLETADYLLGEMVGIYRSMAVSVEDNHFEVVLRQMLDKVEIAAVGDTDLEVGEVISSAQLEAVNSAVSGEPAAGESIILGVTEAAIQGQDFLGAALSFGGIPALARAAARQQKVELDGIRNCTAFGKVIPARH